MELAAPIGTWPSGSSQAKVSLGIGRRDQPTSRVAKFECNVEIGSNGSHVATDSIGVLRGDCKAEQVHVVVGLNDPGAAPGAAVGRESRCSAAGVAMVIAAVTESVGCTGQDGKVVLEDGRSI